MYLDLGSDQGIEQKIAPSKRIQELGTWNLVDRYNHKYVVILCRYLWVFLGFFFSPRFFG